MAKRFDSTTLKQLASVGARARLAELDRERAALLAMFPALRRGATAPSVARPARGRRRRRRMTAAERRAVSERMKRYWAARRKAKGGGKG